MFHLGLLAFVIYLPILAIILGYLAPKKYPGYSFKTHWISNLGEKKSPSYPLFTLGLRLLSFLGLFFILNFDHGPLTFLAGLSVILFIFIITFLPMDLNLRIHMKLARFLFLSLFLFNLTLLPQLNLFALLQIILLIFFSISGLLLYRKYPPFETPNLIKVRERETSFFIRNNTLLEWLVFANQAIWLFLTGIVLL